MREGEKGRESKEKEGEEGREKEKEEGREERTERQREREEAQLEAVVVVAREEGWQPPGGG